MVKLFLKNSNLCDHNLPTSQTDRRTDGQTDRQTTCDRNTALCTKVHRAVKTVNYLSLNDSKILCKLSTGTKRYSSHTILQNFILPTKQRPLLSTAILWSTTAQQRLAIFNVTARRSVPDNQRSWPSCRWQLDGGGTTPTPPVQHDPQS